MANLFLAIFLVVFGLNMLVRLTVPLWILGILALVAGVLLLVERYNVRVDRK